MKGTGNFYWHCCPRIPNCICKYHKSIVSLQGFLILICVGIYSVLISQAAISDDLIASLWGVVGYSVLLCFTLFKTGALARAVLNTR